MEFAPQLRQSVLHLVLRPVQQPLECLAPEFPDEFIRVLRPLHLQDPHVEAGLVQNGDGPLGGVDPGGVPVVGQDDLLGVAGDEAGMILGQRGTERGYGTVKARLVQGDGVHIPLRQNQSARLGALGQVQGEQVFAFVVDRCIRRVQILGCGVVQHPSAEADDIPPHVNDGEHDPAPEAVINGAFLTLHRQAGVQHLPFGVALLGHGANQGVPGVQGVAHAEVGDRPAGQAPALEIGGGLLGVRVGQVAVEISGGLLVQLEQAFPPLPAVGVLVGVGHLHPRPLGQDGHGVHEPHILHLHDEVDGSAALVAAEAIAHLLIR